MLSVGLLSPSTRVWAAPTRVYGVGVFVCLSLRVRRCRFVRAPCAYCSLGVRLLATRRNSPSWSGTRGRPEQKTPYNYTVRIANHNIPKPKTFAHAETVALQKCCLSWFSYLLWVLNEPNMLAPRLRSHNDNDDDDDDGCLTQEWSSVLPSCLCPRVP